MASYQPCTWGYQSLLISIGKLLELFTRGLDNQSIRNTMTMVCYRMKLFCPDALSPPPPATPATTTPNESLRLVGGSLSPSTCDTSLIDPLLSSSPLSLVASVILFN